MDFAILSENSFWAIPLVVAIVEALKMSGFNPKLSPIISLIIGVGLSFLINANLTMGETVVSGIIYGLTASGVYSQIKTTSNIRGKIPLRTEKEAVQVERIEIEKPLDESVVTKPKEDVTIQKNASTQNETTNPNKNGNPPLQ
jgi:hypothetical protein